MNILMVTPYFASKNPGGTERHVTTLIDYLEQLYGDKIDISILTTKEERIKTCEEIYEIKSIFQLFNFNPIVINLPEINSIIKKNKFDIVHFHGHLYFFNYFTAIFSKLKKNKNILSLHGGVSSPKNIPLKSKIMKSAYDKIFGSTFVRLIDTITSVSATDLESFKNMYNIKLKPLKYVPNGVDINKFAYIPLQKRENISDKFRVGYVGDLEYWKGTDLLIDIVKQIVLNPNIEILIAGTGRFREEFVELDKRYSNLKYFGKINHSSVPNFMSNLHLFLFPSRWEGLPTTVLESLSCGTPVIANKIPELERIFDEKSIFYVERSDHNSFIEKILYLKNEGYNTLRKISENGRTIIENNFSFANIAKKYFQIYNELIK